MRSFLLLGWVLATVLVTVPVHAKTGGVPAGSLWKAIVVSETSVPVTLAVTDLQRYLGQVSGEVPQLLTPEEWNKAPCPAVILGNPEGNPLLAGRTDLLDGVSAQGYRLQQETVRGASVVVAAARSSEGLVNAVYGLLHELGFGFYLGSEALPPHLPSGLTSSSLVHNPVFAIRGVLPWYNFFNSPTTWDPVDHRALVDQLVRMRANFLGFHVYDDEPFAAYEEKGQMTAGMRLADSSRPVWSTHPMPTRDFSSGTSGLFADEYFGAETTKESDGDRAIRLEQEIMHEALSYARSRGLHACIGFEVAGYPTRSRESERFLQRFNALLDRYPAADYVWLWQPEMRGARGTAVPMERNAAGEWTTSEPLGLYGLARREIYARAAEAKANPRYLAEGVRGELARATEGARMELYARLALRALSRRADPPRLIISGWGGEDRMIAAEYYEGLDKVLPRDVIFASLDFMVPRGRIDSIYSELPPDRERWVIPWLEYDGDQWHPQSYVQTYADIMRNARASGSKGILGIHWRTREVEENLAYVVQYAWDPDLTPARFYDDYARRLFPGDLATSMSGILAELDRLGYRWVGGKGQAEYNRFTWGPGTDPRKAQKLRELLEQIRALMHRAGSGRARLEWLAHRIEYVLAFQKMAEAAVKARELLTDAAAAAPDTKRVQELARDALRVLDPGLLHHALQTYALRVSTRGEHGVLATINTKAVPDWRELVQEASRLAGEKYTTPTAVWRPAPRILLPRFLGSWSAGSALELHPVVLGDRPAWTHYRRIGEKQWQSESLSLLQRFVHYAQIPARAVQVPGVEVAFSFSESPQEPFAWGPVGVTAMPRVPAWEPRSPAERGDSGTTATPSTVRLRVGSPDGAFVRLEWSDVPQADYFRIKRDGAVVAETPVTFYLDLKQPGAKYTVEAWREGKMVASSNR